MMHFPNIMAGAGGGKGGGGTPSEAPDSIFTNQIARVLDLISEGEIEGLVNGLKSVYYNEIPLQNPDGTYNFTGATVAINNGTTTQPVIPGFDDIRSSISVAQDLKYNTAKSVSFPNDGDVSAVIVTISGSNWYQSDNNGNVGATSCSFMIEKSENGGAFSTVGTYTISGKQNAEFDIDYRVQIINTSGQTAIRVTRTTSDTTTLKVSNTITFKTYTKCSEVKLAYPNMAVAGHIINAKQFGNQIPTRQYMAKGLKCRVPSNYDPVARIYTGAWDGTFKAAKAWTNNAAWIYLELLSNKRWGLGQFLKDTWVDLPSLYTLAKWTDGFEARHPVGTAGTTNDYGPNGCHGVPDGKGGFEPRWTINTHVTQRGAAFDLLKNMVSSFRGNLYWMQSKLWALADNPRSPVKIVTNANVIGGKFRYSGNANRSRNSVVNVTFNDPDLNYRNGIETVENGALIRELGYKDTTFGAFGCSSRSQANRLGRAILFTQEFESSLVTYTAAWDHEAVAAGNGPDGIAPGDEILIADKERGNARAGGRVYSSSGGTASGGTVTLDRNVGALNGTGTLYVEHSNGQVEWVTCSYTTADNADTTKTVCTLTQALVQPVAANDLFILVDNGYNAEEYIVIKIAETSTHECQITAVKWDETRWNNIYGTPSLGGTRKYMSMANNKIGLVQPPVGPVTYADRYLYSGDSFQRFIELGWAPSTEPNLSHYLVRYQLNNGDWITVPATSSSQARIPHAIAGSYVVQVLATNGQGFYSQPLEASFTLNAQPDTAALPTGIIQNLVTVPDSGKLAAPTVNAPSTATAGGTLAAGTYYYKVTALNANGETVASNEVSQVTTGTTSTVSLTWNAIAGATSYKIYRGTAAAGESVYYTSNTNSFTDTGAASTAGSPPSSNTATAGTFSTTHVGIAWDLITPTASWLQTQGVAITSGATDPSFRDCLVTVKTMAGAVLRQESVVGNRYEYTRDKMFADNAGTVVAQFKIDVQYRDIYGRISTALTIALSNGAPSNPTGLSVTQGALMNTVKFGVPTYPDFSYCNVWASQTNDPNTSTLVKQDVTGVVNHQNLTAGQQWFYWVSAVDTWGSQSSLTYAGVGTAQSMALYDAVGQDGTLSTVEKQYINREFVQLTNEQANLDTQATNFSITTEKTNYDNAYTTLKNYLTGLNPAYTDTTQNTPIVRATWNNNWEALYTARQTLLNKIDSVASTLSTWAGVSSRPANVAALGGSEYINNNLVSIGANGQLTYGGGLNGGQVTIGGLGYSGALNATYNNPRGGWSATASYAVNDMVVYSGTIYICIAAVSTATAPPNDTAHWTNYSAVGVADGATVGAEAGVNLYRQGRSIRINNADNEDFSISGGRLRRYTGDTALTQYVDNSVLSMGSNGLLSNNGTNIGQVTFQGLGTPLGTNLIVNSEMTLVDPSFSGTYPLGFSAAWTGNPTTAYSAYSDAIVTLSDGSYAFSRSLTGTPNSGSAVDGLSTYNGGGTNGPRFWIPATPGDTFAVSGLGAGQGVTGFLVELQFADETFVASGEKGVPSGYTTPYNLGANGFGTIGRSVMASSNGTIVIPPDNDASLTGTKRVRWVRWNCRFTVDGTANPRLLVDSPFVAKVPTGQTAVPPYVPGPSDRQATYGALAGSNLRRSDGTTVINYADNADIGITGGQLRRYSGDTGLTNYVDNGVIGINAGRLARWSGDTALTPYVDNASLSMANNGLLTNGSGASLGQVTLSGVGFTGDTDAQRNSRISVDGSGLLQGIGTGAGTAVSNGVINLTSGRLVRYAGDTQYTNLIDNAYAQIGSNLVINSEMGVMGDGTRGATGVPIGYVGYGLGAGYSSGSYAYTRQALADGTYAMLTNCTGTSAPVSGNPYVDVLGYAYADPSFMVAVKPGDTLVASCLVAGNGISSAYVEIQYRDETCTNYAGEQGSSSLAVYSYGAAAFSTVSRNQMTKLSGVFVVPADGSLVAGKNIRWARIHVRAFINAANMNALASAPFVAVVPAGQTVVPPYAPGPSDRLATAGAVSGVNIRNSGGTILGDGDVVNQDGVNSITNSDFSMVGNNLYGWSGSWAGNVPNSTVTWGVNYSGYFGQLNVAYAHCVNSASPGSVGAVFDGHWHFPTNNGPSPATANQWAMPVAPGEYVFASMLAAGHRCKVSPYIQFLDQNGNGLGPGDIQLNTYAGRQGGGANGDPANFDRLYVFGTVPTGARFAVLRPRAQTNQASTDTDSWMFYTQMMLCKVPVGMTTPPPYAPGVRNYYPALAYAGSGQRLGDSRNIPPIQAAGTRYAFNQNPTYSASAGSPATATITMPASTLTLGTSVVSYNSMSVSVTGTGGTTVTYYLYADDPNWSGGTQTLNATTDSTVPYKADGRVYFGSIQVTYPASGTSSGGGTGGGGGGLTCVFADSWVLTLRGYVRARNVRVGDYLVVLDYATMETIRYERVTANRIGYSRGWEIFTKDRSAQVNVSESTPLTLRDGSTILPCQLVGQELPTLIDGEFAWKPCYALPVGHKKNEVSHISCDEGTYAAGLEKDHLILTHNTTAKP